LQGSLLAKPLFLFCVLLPAKGVASNDKTLLHFFDHELELVVGQRGVIEGIFEIHWGYRASGGDLRI